MASAPAADPSAAAGSAVMAASVPAEVRSVPGVMTAAAKGALCSVGAAAPLSAIMAARMSTGVAGGPFAITADSVSWSATRPFVQAV